jgi:hypothetical protein
MEDDVKMTPVSGLLYSQIGYDLGCPMRAMFRSTERDALPPDARFAVRDVASGDDVLTGPAAYWGELWGSHWWAADFSALDREGEYRVALRAGEREIVASETFRVGPHLLWEETIRAVALEQMEERARLARNGKGWKDCGTAWREVNSHTTTIIALCDLWNLGYEWMGEDDLRRLAAQVIVGCDYVVTCQDRARDVGLDKGAIVHEMPNHEVVIPGDLAQSTVALAYASRLLYEQDRERSVDYLKRAERAFLYLTERCRPYGPDGFSAWNHGAPEGYRPRGWMTRDLLMMTWGAVELWAAGRPRYRDVAVKLARRVMRRQVRRDAPEGEYYGHFYGFGDRAFTEKANTHHHVGHDTGATFPHYIQPLIEMARRWPDHPEAGRWRQAVHDFAYGYFLPACRANPFYLLPVGYFAGQGLLTFCGPWHGFNTTYGFAAALAAELELLSGDVAFRQIATGNIQWIAGLHAGVTRESLAGCFFWKDDIPEGAALPYSQIYGVGQRWVGNWTGIHGSVANGFCTNPQFQLVVEPTVENDSPRLYTDEDWIPHAAGWLSALVKLRQTQWFHR